VSGEFLLAEHAGEKSPIVLSPVEIDHVSAGQLGFREDHSASALSPLVSSPHEAKRNAGLRVARPAPDFAALHPGYALLVALSIIKLCPAAASKLTTINSAGAPERTFHSFSFATRVAA
jgi:hypothetical protein